MVATPAVTFQELPFYDSDLPTPPSSPVNPPPILASAALHTTDSSSSSPATPSPLFTSTAAATTVVTAAPAPTMTAKAATTSTTALSSFFRTRLESVGEITPHNWAEWSKLASGLVGAIVGDALAGKKLKGELEKKEDDEEGSWSLLAFIFKEVVEEFGGAEAATRIRHLETDEGDATTLWTTLSTAYDETTSGAEATTSLIDLTQTTYDAETTSPATLAASLRLKQQRVNTVFKREAERAKKATPALATDPSVLAALASSYNNFMLKALFIHLLPPDYARLLEDLNRDDPFDTIVSRAERMWQDERQRRTTEELSALRVGGGGGESKRREVRPAPNAAATPAAKDGTTKAPTKKKYPMRVTATKFTNYQNWRGGTRTNNNGVVLFNTPEDSCFRCFKEGHFSRDCHLDDPARARVRIAEMAKCNITVPFADALALFVDNNEHASTKPSGEEEDKPVARFVGDAGTTSFAVDEDLLKFYFVEHHAYAVDTDAPPPLSSLVLPASLPTDYVLDSGASRHYTTRLDDLHDFKPFEKPVRVGGAFGAGGWAYGSGHLIYSLSNTRFGIRNVYYVPLLGVNLLSQTSLMLAGVSFTNTKEKIFARAEDGSLLFSLPVKPTIRILVRPVSSRSSPSSSLPSIQTPDTPAADSTNERALSVQSSRANPLVWHGRTGHVSAERVRLLSGELSTGMNVDGSLAILDTLSCSSCAEGKLRRKAVERAALNRAERPLERLAADVWGPCAVKGRKGEQYLVGIVDDASRYMWVQPMGTKSEAAGIIAARIQREERKKGVQVASLRTDRGGEFVNQSFDAHLKQKGIQHETTIPYKHAQNGLIERQWQPIFEMARCWLARSGLPLSFWDLASRAATHVKNLLPTSANPNSASPHQIFYGKAPDVSHLRVWGCVCYVREEKVASKVHPRGTRGRFVGYLEDSKGWMVWLPEKGKVVEAWDVLFMEEEFENVRSEVENGSLERWLSQLEWWGDEEASGQEEEEGNKSPSPSSSSPTATTPEPAHQTSQQPPPTTHTPSNPSSNETTSSSTAPTPTSRSSRGPPVRHSRRLANESAPHFVPLEGAPTPPTPSTDDEAIPPPPADDPTALPLSAFFASSRPSPMPNSTSLAYATFDSTLDSDPSAENLAASPELALSAQTWTGSLDEPTYRQAMAGPDAEKWKLAMETELAAFRALGTWDDELVELPSGRRALPVKWVLVVKRDAEGRIVKFKARLVARGDRQVEGQDFDETHSSTVRLTTVRLLLAILAHDSSCRSLQFDVSSAYLHGELDRDIYLQQPLGFADPSRPHLVRRLRKALYGLRQGGREWQKVFRAALEQLGFRRSDADHGLYVRRRNGRVCFVAAHVDDGLVVGNEDDLGEVVRALDGKFEGGVRETTDGLFLGMRIGRRDDGSISADQRHYAQAVLDRFFPSSLSPISTPCDSNSPIPLPADESERFECPYRELLGALVYLVTCTRPDLAYPVAVASRFAACPAERHWKYLQRICRYLTGTTSLGLLYRPPASPAPLSASLLSGWSDADHAGDRETRRSVSGFVFTFGVDPLSACAVSWCSRRQKSVTISSTEAEYVALSEAAREGMWLRQLLHDLHLSPSSPTLLRGDNSGSLILATHPSSHSRTKHIGVHYHFTREKVEEGVMTLKWVPTAGMVADIMTKGLGTAKHLLFLGMCGLVDVSREGGCRREQLSATESKAKEGDKED